MLQEDGLLEDASDYFELKFSMGRLLVNGQKQSRELYKKYAEIYAKTTMGDKNKIPKLGTVIISSQP